MKYFSELKLKGLGAWQREAVIMYRACAELAKEEGVTFETYCWGEDFDPWDCYRWEVAEAEGEQQEEKYEAGGEQQEEQEAEGEQGEEHEAEGKQDEEWQNDECINSIGIDECINSIGMEWQDGECINSIGIDECINSIGMGEPDETFIQYAEGDNSEGSCASFAVWTTSAKGSQTLSRTGQMSNPQVSVARRTACHRALVRGGV